MSHEILPMSHCKLCGEEAQDCECDHHPVSKRLPWQIHGEDPWTELKCDHAQLILLDWIIKKIEECKEPVTLSALKSMHSRIMEIRGM
jgi:hypothetical protein